MAALRFHSVESLILRFPMIFSRDVSDLFFSASAEKSVVERTKKKRLIRPGV